MKKIKLSRQRFALVDDEDFRQLNKLNWYYNPAGSVGYAAHDSVDQRILMHRVIIKAKPGELVDHINRNSLDNRRKNLRLANKRLNALNSYKRRGCSSEFKGVSYHRPTGKWRAYHFDYGKQIHLGLFNTQSEAKKVREQYGPSS